MGAIDVRKRTGFILFLFAFFFASAALADPSKKIKYEDLTPFEKGSFGVFLDQNGGYSSGVDPRHIARKIWSSEPWENGQRPDSFERLKEFYPPLAAMIEEGRQKRFQFYREVMDSESALLRGDGVRIDLAQQIATKYFELLRTHGQSKAKVPPWLASEAEKQIRDRWKTTFLALSKEESEKGIAHFSPDPEPKEGSGAGTPTESNLKKEKADAAGEKNTPPPSVAISPLPRSKWPKEIEDDYQSYLERLKNTLPPDNSVKSLPPEVFFEWLNWSKKQIVDQLSRLEVCSKRHVGYDEKAAYHKELTTRLQNQANLLLNAVNNHSMFPDGPKGLHKFLQDRMYRNAESQNRLETEVFGPSDTRLGGSETTVRDPSLAWLLDLQWSSENIMNKKSADRWKLPRVYKILDPKKWGRERWQTVREMAAGLSSLAVTGALVVGVGAHFIDPVLPHTGGQLKLEAKEHPVNTRPNENRTPVFFVENAAEINHLAMARRPDLELPKASDLKGKLKTIESVEGPPGYIVTNQVPAYAQDGKYVMIPRIFGTLPRVMITNSSKGQLRPGIDYSLVESEKGYPFIELKDPNSGAIYYQIDYVPNQASKRVQTPEEPKISADKNKERAALVEQAQFSKLGNAFKGLSDLPFPIPVDVIKNQIRTNSLYSDIPARKLPNYFSSNPIEQFRGFRDYSGNLCPDCDVSNDFLKDYVEPVMPDKQNWKLELRDCYAADPDGNYLRKGLHTKLFGWKKGFRDPLIWDATPTEKDQRSSPTSDHPIPAQPWLHRFRFRGDLGLQDQTGPHLPPEPPDLDDPKIRKELERDKNFRNESIFLDDLNHATRNEISARNSRNQERRDFLNRATCWVMVLPPWA